MHRTPPASIARAPIRSRRTTRTRGTPHQRLARTNRTGINRPPRNRTRWPAGRHSRTWRRGRARQRRPRQPRDHIRPWRDDGTRSRLPRKIRFRGWTQRSASAGGRRRSRCSGRPGPHRRPRRRNTRNGCRGRARNARNRYRRSRPRAFSSIRRHGLPRTRQDLSWFRRRHGPRRNRGTPRGSVNRNPRMTNRSRSRSRGSRMRGSRSSMRDSRSMRHGRSCMRRRRVCRSRVRSRKTRQRRTQRMNGPRSWRSRFFRDSFGGLSYRRGGFSLGSGLRTNRLRYRLRRLDYRRGWLVLHFGSGATATSSAQPAANLRHHVIVERARVRLLIHDA